MSGVRHIRRAGTVAALATFAILALAVVAPQAHAQDAHLRILGTKLQNRLDALAADMPGVVGIQVVDLTSGQRFGVNDQLVFPQGSAIKVPLLIELFRQADDGELSLDEQVVISDEDDVGGSGYLHYFSSGTSALSLHDLAIMMIVVSDNMATNLLIERVGMDNVNRTMAQLGLPDTKLQRMMIRPQESMRGNENISTPQQAAALMEMIYRCDLPLSDASCRALRDILEIPHAGSIADAVPGNIVVGQKTGSIAGVSVNWGYVDLPTRPYVIAVMGNYGQTGRISQTIRAVADATHEYFEVLAGVTPYGTRVR